MIQDSKKGWVNFFGGYGYDTISSQIKRLSPISFGGSGIENNIKRG